MGLTWCRERIEQAQNSKSPVDRILVCCSNVIKPKTPYSHSQGKVVNDFVYKGMSRNKNLGISPPVPIHAVPPRARNKTQKNSDWQTCTLTIPESEDISKPPIPPPRKKRKPKLNSMEVLNNELPELHSPSYVIYSENLLNKNFAHVDSADTNETDVLRPLEKSYYRERTSGSDRFGKLSGNRTRKIKMESHPNDVKEKRVKNDNEKRTEQKIKHISTVSLPNYNELVKPSRKVSTDVENSDDKTGNQSVGLKHPRRNSSTISLPGEGSNSILSSLSEATIHRLETYMKRCRSFGALRPQQLLEKLEEFNKNNRSASESSDSWSGLDDWDLGIIEYCDSETQAPPLTPKSTLPTKQEKDSFQSQNEDSSRSEENDENKVNEEMRDSTTEVKETSKGRTPIIHRCESIIEGIPIEWFLNPSLRAPAIMPPPVVSESQKLTKTPPPSPENNNEDCPKDSEDQIEEHSSLLNLLRQYKDESDEPEVELNMNEILNDIHNFESESKNHLTFDEVDITIPVGETTNPFLSFKNRSNSLALEKQEKLLVPEKPKPRSPSIGFESSTHLLKQLQSNEDKIEKEILLKPQELIQSLRRESLCQSLPEDAFEAYVNKRKPSLRESLTDFLGFQDEKKPNQSDDENLKKASDERSDDLNKEEKKDKVDEEKTPSVAPPPPPVNPPPVVINPPSEEEKTPVPHSLVRSNDSNII